MLVSARQNKATKGCESSPRGEQCSAPHTQRGKSWTDTHKKEKLCEKMQQNSLLGPDESGKSRTVRQAEASDCSYHLQHHGGSR